MNSLREVIIVLFLVTLIPGAYGTTIGFSTSDGGITSSALTTVMPGNNFQQTTETQAGFLASKSLGTGSMPEEYHSVADSAGNSAAVDAKVEGSSSTKWAYDWRTSKSDLIGQWVKAEEWLSASNANSINVWAQAQNKEGDSAYAQTDIMKGSLSNYYTKATATPTAASVAQSADSATGYSISSSAGGSGDLGTTASGEEGLTSSDQNALVSNGYLASSQSAETRQGVSTSKQDTKITGDTGAINSKSVSTDNSMSVIGGYSGSGDLSAKLTSVAADRAGISGTATVLGNKCFDSDVLKTISSGDLAVETSGLYQDRKGGLGNYEVAAINVKTSNAVSASDPGYKLTGYRWVNNPQIKVQVAESTTPTSIRSSVVNQIGLATSQWDSNTNQNLYSSVGSTTYVPSWSKRYTTDGKNVQVWTTSLSSPIIASTITWYSTNLNLKVTGADGKKYYRAIESDTWYNKNLAWGVASAESSSTNSKFDVRTIATHELGHTIGLADLYSSADSNQIMYGYNNGQVKWNLRSGDVTGLHKLYGN